MNVEMFKCMQRKAVKTIVSIFGLRKNNQGLYSDVRQNIKKLANNSIKFNKQFMTLEKVMKAVLNYYIGCVELCTYLF